MDERNDIVNSIMSEDDVNKILEEAVACSAEMEVGEATRMILGFFERMPNMKMFTDYVKNMEKDERENFDEFLINLMMSLIMTLMDNYQKREKESAKA